MAGHAGNSKAAMKTAEPNLRAFAALTAAMLLLTAGCAKREAAADTAPFERAIVEYLRQKSMGLRIAQFRTLTIQDDTATAIVSLEHEEGMVGPKVRWTFAFRQQNGTWRATHHEQ